MQLCKNIQIQSSNYETKPAEKLKIKQPKSNAKIQTPDLILETQNFNI